MKKKQVSTVIINKIKGNKVKKGKSFSTSQFSVKKNVSKNIVQISHMGMRLQIGATDAFFDANYDKFLVDFRLGSAVFGAKTLRY